jgi:hypothetical protein
LQYIIPAHIPVHVLCSLNSVYCMKHPPGCSVDILENLQFLSRVELDVLTQYCAGSKIEKNEIGGVCGAYGGGERCAQGSGGVT